MKRMMLLAICLMLGAQGLPAKRIKKNIYTVLEKEVPPSKFDDEGFYKRSYDELKLYLEQHPAATRSGGRYCMGQSPFITGYIAGSNSQGQLFSKGDTVEIEVKDAVAGCSKGTVYVVLEKMSSGIYNVIAELESMEKALKETRCVAKLTEVYAPIKRNAELAYPLSSGVPATTQLKDLITGKVEDAWGERACIKFATGYLPPDPGTIVYFYQIKDPLNNKEIDPFVVATGKLIYVNGQYGTAVVDPSARAVTKGTSVTTRF